MLASGTVLGNQRVYYAGILAAMAPVWHSRLNFDEIFSPDVGLMLGKHCKQWTNIKLSLICSCNHDLQ